ncbi:MAG: D-alanine--D-alanine ligase [Oscillospiraceae bacterium]|nr:D-alanine--D-alanine ligase [Oscillospiraceae bacterium]
MKPTIGIFFGGKTTEHEVSIITGLQAFAAIEREKYDCVPVYITKSNDFYAGESVGKIEEYSNIPALLKDTKKCKQVTLLNQGGKVGLYEVTPKKIDVRKPLAILDIALPCVHGTNAEDGTLQGFFEMLRLPYAGCDVLSSAIGMDKYVQKTVLKQAGIPVLDCVTFSAKRFVNEKESLLIEIAAKIGTPAIVKPINLGSSIGISIAANHDELITSIENALLFSERIIVESAIANLKEINVSVSGDKDEAEASECEEPVASNPGNSSGKILDYNDKYSGGEKNGKNSSKSSGMASLKRKIPAEISPAVRDEIRNTAVKAFKALGCSGVARIDFLIDNDSNKIYFNEINTIPGSLSFYLWEPLGISYSDLLEKTFTLALKRERERANLNFSFESNILSGFKGGFKNGKNPNGSKT